MSKFPQDPGVFQFGAALQATAKISRGCCMVLFQDPELLLGGDGLEAGRKRCESFWKRFENERPIHKVFETFESSDLQWVIPVCLHGDKGTTLKKSPIALLQLGSNFWTTTKYL